VVEDLERTARKQPVRPVARAARALVVLVAALIGGLGALSLATVALTAPAAPSAGAVALDSALARLAAGAGALLLAWWSLGLLACAAAALSRPARSTVSRRLAATLPRPLRLATAAVLGVAITAGTTVPAALAVPAPALAAVQVLEAGAAVDPAWPATPAPSASESRGADSADHLAKRSEPVSVPETPAPGWAPERPAAVRKAAEPGLLVPQPRSATVVVDDVVVRQGDTLWDICARHLGGEATDAEIATEWPRWYEANGDVLGDDPDHLEPGQRLRPPAMA
jgi:nucleoid-associated protein YgaU